MQLESPIDRGGRTHSHYRPQNENPRSQPLPPSTDIHGHSTDTIHGHPRPLFAKAQVTATATPQPLRTPATDATLSPFRGEGRVAPPTAPR